ncbi:hypothetical protein E2C01_086718 [Portunus trituberculatus]|uniref:Uncharacterized protein n=1 Tax=Portunus trituberculatus TaxID=210409 RepID=A0A5B7JAH4_PORTR|nr:hypothetical protein [Portunus trituberculatus]
MRDADNEEERRKVCITNPVSGDPLILVPYFTGPSPLRPFTQRLVTRADPSLPPPPPLLSVCLSVCLFVCPSVCFHSFCCCCFSVCVSCL